MIANEDLTHKILKTITLLTSHARKRIISHDNIKLYPSEIHLLMSIQTGRDTNLTRIAEHIGLTKGAVSQTVSRLQKKGIIKKDSDTSRKNELRILFTEKGEKLMKHVIQMRNSLVSKYLNYIKTLDDPEKLIISEFLDLMIQST